MPLPLETPLQISYIFFTDTCTEDEVRLNGDVVQVCHDSQWGLVCSSTNSWGISSAEVACRQVGMPSRGQIGTFCIVLIS